MTKPFKFKRWFAQIQETPGAAPTWLIMCEDKPENAQFTGDKFNDKANAMLVAHSLNAANYTGFDAKTNRFTDPSKQAEFEEWQGVVAYQKEKTKAYNTAIALGATPREAEVKARLSSTMTRLKTRNQESENEPTSSMEYPTWGSFGTGKTKEQNTVDWTKVDAMTSEEIAHHLFGKPLSSSSKNENEEPDPNDEHKGGYL